MRSIAVATALLLAAVDAAQADVVTQTVTGIELSNEDTGTAQQIQGNYFDPTLGTLNSVTFEYAGSLTPQFTEYAPGVTGPITIHPAIGLQFGSYNSEYFLPTEVATVTQTGLSGLYSASVTGPAENFDVSGTLYGNFLATSHADSLVTYALLDAPYGIKQRRRSGNQRYHRGKRHVHHLL